MTPTPETPAGGLTTAERKRLAEARHGRLALTDEQIEAVEGILADRTGTRAFYEEGVVHGREQARAEDRARIEAAAIMRFANQIATPKPGEHGPTLHRVWLDAQEAAENLLATEDGDRP